MSSLTPLFISDPVCFLKIIPVLRILELPELPDGVPELDTAAVDFVVETGGPVLETPRVQITLAPSAGHTHLC